MSDNYKIIRRTREAVKDLKSQGWSHTKIAKEIGIAVAMVQDILDIDEVALNVRGPTMIKFREYLRRHKVERAEPVPEPVPDPPAPDLEQQHLRPVLKQFVISDDLLAMTDSLIAEYNERGYRMDVTISKINIPGFDRPQKKPNDEK